MLGCNNKTQQAETKTPEKAQKAPPKKKEAPTRPKPQKKEKWVSLTNKNLEKVLTQYGKENKETLILLETPKGNMKIKLYNNTPLHRANIIRLIKNNFYEGTVFYRVVKDFIIQGGDSDDWSRSTLEDKMGKYTLPAEFRDNNIHKRGALSMAREYDDNPEKRSVPFEFFIVQGTKYTGPQLRGAEQTYGLDISEKHKEIYKTQGGCPHLDGQHTVFGQVIEGLNVIDSIAAVKVDQGDWPINDVTISFKILD